MKHKLSTPRTGKAWCDVINKDPLPKPQPSQRVVLRTIDAAEYRELAPVLNGPQP